jgi:hypothetical protein
VNVAVCFHLCVNDASCKRVPLSSDGILASVMPVKSTFGPSPSHA